MPSGPKKRKAAKRKEEALHIHIGDASVASIPSPGTDIESGGEMASPMTPDDREVESVEVMEVACGLGGEVGLEDTLENGGHISASVEEQDTMTRKKEEPVDAPYEARKVESDLYAPKPKDEIVNNMVACEDGCIGDSGAATVNEMRKAVYAGESSHVIEQPVSWTEEVKSSEVPIERIGGLSPGEEKLAIEPVGKIEASIMVNPVLAFYKQEDVSLFGTPSSKPPTGFVERLLDVGSRETENAVALPPQEARKTSWMSCCGLLDVFSGSNR